MIAFGAELEVHRLHAPGLVPSLVSYIDSENEPSKRVAKRLGADPEEMIELLGYGPHRVYRYPKPAGF
ncbi:MAG: hypothetical protein ACODAA_06680 [Gemmatimonadota bacterium]